MESNPPGALDRAAVVALLFEAGSILKQPRSNEAIDRSGAAKNEYGDIVNDLDYAVQTLLFKRLKEADRTHVFVGEEDIGGGCLSKFPEPVDPNTIYCTLDPIDGSKNWSIQNSDYAITVGWQRGREVIYGIIYMPVSGTIITAGTDSDLTITRVAVWTDTICHMAAGPSKSYDPDNIRVGFGLGKIKTQAEQAKFLTAISTVTTELTRYGCASKSLLEILEGRLDAYLSLKEAWTNIAPWYAILKKTGLVVNVDPATLNLNTPFCLVVATGEFMENHLQPGSDLEKCLKN